MAVMRKDYLSVPRSREIRDISLNMLAAFEALLYGEPSMNAQAHAQLEHCNGQLVALGVTPRMKTGLSSDLYDDPVTAAEYLAGQLLDGLGHISLSEREVARLIEEWSDENLGNGHLLSLENMPSEIQAFRVHRDVIARVANNFDRSEQEAKERAWC